MIIDKIMFLKGWKVFLCEKLSKNPSTGKENANLVNLFRHRGSGWHLIKVELNCFRLKLENCRFFTRRLSISAATFFVKRYSLYLFYEKQLQKDLFEAVDSFFKKYSYTTDSIGKINANGLSDVDNQRTEMVRAVFFLRKNRFIKLLLKQNFDVW